MVVAVLRWIVLFGVVWATGMKLPAQDFKVRQFRILPNDISAYIAPVYDLNHEACALLKVVCEDRFAFSTPLGIAQRKDEVGEVWLYVPRNTRIITLKHPQWGVLRDYTFPVALESRMTYELVVEAPMSVRIDRFLRVAPRRERFSGFTHSDYLDLRMLPELGMKRMPLKWEPLVAIMVAAGRDLLPGFRMGIVKKHGVYMSVYSDFGRFGRKETGVCDAEGNMMSEDYVPYYTGHTTSGELLLLAGAMHRLHHSWYIYEGVGFGVRKVYWQLTGGEWVQNADYSAEGCTAEIGMMYRHRHYLFSGGVCTLCGSYWMGTLGIGLCF